MRLFPHNWFFGILCRVGKNYLAGELRVIKQTVLAVAALVFLAVICGGVGIAHAGKVDCAKVMTEVGAGKKTKDIAKEMTISTSSVYRCKSKAKAKAKAATASSPAAAASPASHM